MLLCCFVFGVGRLACCACDVLWCVALCWCVLLLVVVLGVACCVVFVWFVACAYGF